ncbi:MAG: hypothetical protein EOO27_09415 [Comamonadaceae bacterium]|nr:MAG: hypothetical protein EOO27_09415 [Comamonadaceae bacterium]
MNKVLISLTLALAGSFASAQLSYEDAAKVEQYCRAYGDLAGMQFRVKQMSEKTGGQVSVARTNAEAEARAKDSGRGLELRLYGIHYAYEFAGTAEDANIATWAKCKDMVVKPAGKGKAKGK